jgi:hypothetical protein
MRIRIPWPIINIPKYRIIANGDTFISQCRSSLFSKWNNISSANHSTLVSEDHWVARHSNIESARRTLQARKLYDELNVLNKLRKNYKEYL